MRLLISGGARQLTVAATTHTFTTTGTPPFDDDVAPITVICCYAAPSPLEVRIEVSMKAALVNKKIRRPSGHVQTTCVRDRNAIVEA